MKKSLGLFLFALMIFSPIFMVMSPHTVRAADPYSATFVVPGDAGTTLTDQWIFINIMTAESTYGSGNTLHINGQGTADFSDIRFTDANGTPLQYVRLFEDDNYQARFAVQLDTVTHDINNLFQVHWGDSDLTDQSNLSAPWFVDLFSGDALNSTLWPVTTEFPQVYEGHLVVVSADAETQVIGSIGITDEGYMVDTRILAAPAYGYDVGILNEFAMINPDIEISSGDTYNSNPGVHALFAQDYNLGGLAYMLSGAWCQFEDNSGPYYWTGVTRSSWDTGIWNTVTLKSPCSAYPGPGGSPAPSSWYMNDVFDAVGYTTNGYITNVHPEYAADGSTLNYYILADYIIIVPYNDYSITAWATPPGYSTPTASTSVAGASCLVSIPLTDAIALDNVTFSTNNTGMWINATTDTISGTSYLYNSTMTLNSTVGVDVAMKWYIYNTNNAETTTIIYYIVTQPPDVPYYNPTVANSGYVYANRVSWMNFTLDILNGVGTPENISQFIITLSNGVSINVNPSFNSTAEVSDPSGFMNVAGYPTSYVIIKNASELTAYINNIFSDAQPQAAIYITSVQIFDDYQTITLPVALYWCTLTLQQSYVYYNSTADNITIIGMNLPGYHNATVYVNYSHTMNLGWLGIAMVHAFEWSGTTTGSDWSQWGVYLIICIAELLMLISGAHYVAIMGTASAMFLGAVNMAIGIPVISWGVIGTIAFIVIIELLTKKQGVSEAV